MPGTHAHRVAPPVVRGARDRPGEHRRPVEALDEGERRRVAGIDAPAPVHLTLEPVHGEVFGPELAWADIACTGWPVPAATPAPIHAAGAAPILVIGTTRDPATPYAWAQSLASQLDSGRLLTFDGDGHTGYNRGSSCINRAVEAYLVSGKLPAKGLVCH